MTVHFANLGAAGVVVAEYDPRDDAVRIDERAYDCVRERLGSSAAAQFVAYATAHELFHRAHPAAAEREAHAFAERLTGANAKRFERAIRP